MTDDTLYTPEEIAQKLKLTKGTVYEMIKRGDLDAHRIGKSIRISDTQFKLYLLKSTKLENIYDVEIIREDDDIIGEIGDLGIYINTNLEGNARISISPEDIILSKGTFVSSARNMHKGIVKEINEYNNMIKVVLDIGVPITALITIRSLREMNIEIGSELFVIFKTLSVKVFK